jgi:flagellar protein FlaG
MESIRSALTPSTRVEVNAQGTKPGVTQTSTPAAPAAQRADAAGNSAQASAGTATTQDTRDQLQALLDQVGERIQPDLRALSFRVSEEIDGVVVSVIDSQTEELIRQIPTETVVRLAERLKQINAESGSTGLLLNDQA